MTLEQLQKKRDSCVEIINKAMVIVMIVDGGLKKKGMKHVFKKKCHFWFENIFSIWYNGCKGHPVNRIRRNS